jgi:hypothetical protein
MLISDVDDGGTGERGARSHRGSPILSRLQVAQALGFPGRLFHIHQCEKGARWDAP